MIKFGDVADVSSSLIVTWNEIWQKNIDNLDDKKLFDYLTIERGNYQLEAIEYAENLLNEKKISLIHLQKKYNYMRRRQEADDNHTMRVALRWRIIEPQ